jgi:hypothetical protein
LSAFYVFDGAAAIGETILATVSEAIASNGTLDLPVGGAGWRYEVTSNGKYWQWRKGSKQNRISIYGGKFETLPTERRAAYEQRKRKTQQA